MRIVILDAFTTNPGDLDWAPVAALGELAVHDRTPDDEIVARAAGAEAVLTNKTPLTAATLAALPALKYVGVLATGVNVVDLAAAAAAGITVTNVPGYSTPGVAQAVFALLLELTNQTGSLSASARAGRWQACDDFCYWDGELVELEGLSLGIVGYGTLGQGVARAAQAFGMEVLLANRPGGMAVAGRLELDELLPQVDVLSLHCPLTPAPEGLIGGRQLARMKPDAVLINTARGALVDSAALAAALRAGRLGGAAIDVLPQEPPVAGNPLLEGDIPSLIVTPHIAWAAREARQRCLDEMAANVEDFRRGGRRGRVC